jgi:hypothetical protein
MEQDPLSVDLSGDLTDLEYQNVDDGGSMLVEDSVRNVALFIQFSLFFPLFLALTHILLL